MKWRRVTLNPLGGPNSKQPLDKQNQGVSLEPLRCAHKCIDHQKKIGTWQLISQVPLYVLAFYKGHKFGSTIWVLFMWNVRGRILSSDREYK